MPHERSNLGCWTCRLRKKKCDEKLPICWACQSRVITCHGYGAKPEWMDGAENERKEAERLKRALKESLKQKKSLGVTISQRPNGFIDSWTPHFPSSEPIFGETLSYYSPPMAAVMTTPISLDSRPDSIGHSLNLARNEDPATHPPSIKDFESTLLMNYLDHVFPLQFNCYTPPVIVFGRGWLLALLTRTKPLYHAALALSCFYGHSVLLKTKSEHSRCVAGHWEYMNRYHALAFQGLQDQISISNSGETESSLKENIEILACIIQLISFELLKGGTDSWPIHLTAASSILPALMAARKTLPGTASNTEQFDEGEQYPLVDEIACDFLVGVFVWFDIIGSASTRSKPCLKNNIQHLGNIELDKVMGCESSIMILVANISQMEEWKREMKRLGRLSVLELSNRGSEIEKLLHNVLARQTARPCAPIPANPASRHFSTITKIFAHAALTYLHTVVSGAHPDLPEIKASVAMTLAEFRNLPDPKLMQNLIWPFCVTGCMSSRDQNLLFRSLLVGLDIDERRPGNYWKAFEVIQECWKLREEQEEESGEVDWTSAMSSLGFQVLLV